MASRIRIAIDCMGGDHGLRASLPAALQALEHYSDLDVILVGDEAQIAALLPSDIDNQRVDVRHAPELVAMAEQPSVALRKKRHSSMRLAIDCLGEGRADAVVSAGNTGALMAMGCLVLKTLTGIDRPAICSALPTRQGHCHILDLGANVDCSAENLYQFALMGSALAATLDANHQARVAVLNIGEEEIKGNDRVKLAAQMINADSALNFIGSIEGDTLFKGEADVVVCDGFVGNVALKVCEGTASYIGAMIKRQFNKNRFNRLLGLLARPVLKPLYQAMDPQQYNGASFLGLQGIVIKSHGNSTSASFLQAIAKARTEVQSNTIGLIEERLQTMNGDTADNI